MYESAAARPFPWVKLVFAAVSASCIGIALALTLWALRIAFEPPRPGSSAVAERIDPQAARATLAAALREQPAGAHEDADAPSTATVAVLLADPPRLDRMPAPEPASPYPPWPTKVTEPAAPPALTAPAAPPARNLAAPSREPRPPRPAAPIPNPPGAEPGPRLADAAVPVPRNRSQRTAIVPLPRPRPVR